MPLRPIFRFRRFRMNVMRAAFAALAGLAAVPAVPAAADEVTGSRAHDELVRASPLQQRRIADAILRKVGHGDCDVGRLALLGYRAGRFSSWQATCADGRRFVLNFADGPEGTVEILSCRELAAYGGTCLE